MDFIDWILLNLLFAFRAFPEVLNGGVFPHFTGECGPVELLMLSCQKLISGSHHIHFQNKIYIQEATVKPLYYFNVFIIILYKIIRKDFVAYLKFLF